MNKDVDFEYLDQIVHRNNGNFRIESLDIWFNNGAEQNIPESDLNRSRITNISNKLKKYFDNNKSNPLQQLKIFLDFQKVHRTAWGKINREHLNPLFNRINSSLESLEKVI